MRDADMQGVDAKYANFSNADLKGAALRGANLYMAVVVNASMEKADLTDSDIERTDMFMTDLNGSVGVPFIPLACPEEGSFIGYKKCQCKDGTKVIVKLLVPEDAKRLSGTGRKCRCDKAKVLEIQSLEGEKLDMKEAVSIYRNSFVYRVGETVTAKNFDECRWNEFAPGIYFYIGKTEAMY